jgi:hypothetical protein
METKKPRPPMNPEIYRKLADRPDFNKECRAARYIFSTLQFSMNDRKRLSAYCLQNDIIKTHIGSNPEVALFTLKSMLRFMNPPSATRRVHDYVLAEEDDSWYCESIYPEWTGAVTAMISPNEIMYAVHSDDLVSVEPPYSVCDYEGRCGDNLVRLVRQELHSFVGPVLEEAFDAMWSTMSL